MELEYCDQATQVITLELGPPRPTVESSASSRSLVSVVSTREYEPDADEDEPTLVESGVTANVSPIKRRGRKRKVPILDDSALNGITPEESPTTTNEKPKNESRKLEDNDVAANNSITQDNADNLETPSGDANDSKQKCN